MNRKGTERKKEVVVMVECESAGSRGGREGRRMLSQEQVCVREERA